ncbi:MAG: TadG family pilus assembly protein [Solirubrobacteraceae bacterium]|jgi:hypothetical protein
MTDPTVLPHDHDRRSIRLGDAVTRLRRRAGADRGVVLVLTALLMVALLGMAALAIDTGSFRQAEYQAQSAADAGALAAAQDLPANSVSAVSDGSSYASDDDPGATVSVTTPADDNSNEAEVDVTQTVPTFFGQIFGLDETKVSASAVAVEDDTELVSDGDISPQGCAGICNYVAPGVVGTGPWVVTFGNVDLQDCDGGTGEGCTLPPGDTSAEVVDLNGFLPGGIEQTISTLPDENYELTFELSGNPYQGVDGYTFTGDVDINGTLTPFTHQNTPYPTVDFDYKTVAFTTTSTSTTIQFYSTSYRTGLADYAGPEITDISILGPSSSLVR